MAGWAVVQTYGGHERRAIANLERQGYETFLPTYSRSTPTPLGRPPTLPLFPAYVFVLLTEDRSWQPINSTYGVIRLLTDRHRIDPKPLFVQDSFVKSLEGLRAVGRVLEPGTVVRIRQRTSAFFDRVGTVARMGKDQRVWVLMSLFSRDTVVEFDSVDDLEVEAGEERLVLV